MPKLIQTHIPELELMQHYPKELYYLGNTSLLEHPKVSIVGTRKPNQYCQMMTTKLSHQLSSQGVCIVSGGAIGVDALAHKAANECTIMISPAGINHRYPKTNKKLIEQLEQKSLVLSQFEPNYEATPYSFVQRNETVVALGEVLVVTQCDLNSGSMRSVEFALKMQKPIYVLPHQIGQSEGTNYLLEKGLAQPIYSIEKFVEQFSPTVLKEKKESAFTTFCKTNPTYDDALKEFQSELFEAELNGEIEIINGRVQLL